MYITKLFYVRSFNLRRGCRQGNPISPYLFILCAEILGKMVRKNNDIKGIIINGKEYKLSQYADDNQLILDGTEKSLKAALDLLKTNYIMFGLKINVDKTRALWIGSSCGSSGKLCEEYALDWSQESLKILGVTFSPLVFNLWDLNVLEILFKVKHILSQCSKLKLSLSGRITIIKSLALSKFFHLFISLPAPPNGLIKELENMFYNFLWNSGPDRTKRKIIVKNIACASLKMVELKSFIKALKVSWFRRILQQSKPNELTNLSLINSDKFLWNSGPDRIKRKIIVKNIAYAGLRMVELKSFIKALKVSWFRRILQQSKPNEFTKSLINFDKLFSVGSSYATKVSHDLQNPFWKDLMHIWVEYCNILPIENIGHVLEAPLWYNEKIGTLRIGMKTELEWFKILYQKMASYTLLNN